MRHTAINLVVALAGLAPSCNCSMLRPANADECPPVLDRFEAPMVNFRNWSMVQTDPDRYWIERRVVKHGLGALAVRITSGDSHHKDPTEREEIRIARQQRCAFGSDLWYSFSLRIEGQIVDWGSRRWVVGQWKQQGDGSPFLAERFDNRVFHITVQDNNCRVIVAKARGNPFRVLPEDRIGEPRKEPSLPLVSPPDCKTDLRVQRSVNATLPSPYKNWVDMAYRVRGGRNGTGLIEIWADGRFIARVSGSIGYDSGGQGQYFKIGHYRDPQPGSAIVYIDDFRREPYNQQDLLKRPE